MHPELFNIPLTHLSVKTYGLMIIIGFLAALAVIRRLGKGFIPKPQMVTNAGLYALVAGIVGSRIFYVIHYYDRFQNAPLSAIAIWNGGFELLGAVPFTLAAIIIYLIYHRLPIRRILDITAVGLMLALAIGRIGCFFSGCCFGKPTKSPLAVRFPYGSDSFNSQIRPDFKRNRPHPFINLPADFFEEGRLKTKSELTPLQKSMVDNGQICALPVYPTQLFSSAADAAISFLLYLLWRRNRKLEKSGLKKPFSSPGAVFAAMFVFYSVFRFFIEFLRDDNPFESAWWAVYKGGTISQNISIYLFFCGIILLIIFQRLHSKNVTSKH